jgi:hypothetical protein
MNPHSAAASLATGTSVGAVLTGTAHTEVRYRDVLTSFSSSAAEHRDSSRFVLATL